MLALSHSDLGSSAAVMVVLLILGMVRLARSMIALISECLGTVIVPLCLSFSWRVVFLNSHPQSAWVSLVRRFTAPSSWLRIVIRAFPASFLCRKGLTTIYWLWSSTTFIRYRYWFPEVVGFIGPMRSTWIRYSIRFVLIWSFFCRLCVLGFVAFPCSQGSHRIFSCPTFFG